MIYTSMTEALRDAIQAVYEGGENWKDWEDSYAILDAYEIELDSNSPYKNLVHDFLKILIKQDGSGRCTKTSMVAALDILENEQEFASY